MRESGYYPAGAEFDPSAPWNEVDVPDVDFVVDVDHTFHLRPTITSNEYDGGIYDEGYVDDADYNGNATMDFQEQYTSITTAMGMAVSTMKERADKIKSEHMRRGVWESREIADEYFRFLDAIRTMEVYIECDNEIENA